MTDPTNEKAFCDHTGCVFDAGSYSCRCRKSHVAPAFPRFTDERKKPSFVNSDDADVALVTSALADAARAGGLSEGYHRIAAAALKRITARRSTS